MEPVLDEPREFTDEEMRRALREISEKVRQEAFNHGLPLPIYRNGQVILQYPDGREEVVESPDSPEGNGKAG